MTNTPTQLIPETIDPKDVEIKAIQFSCSGYMNSDGFWVETMKATGSDLKYEFVTPYRECPYVVTRWFTKEELDNINSKPTP